MKPIAIFYHGLFALDAPDNLMENAIHLISGQMAELKNCGLLNAASEFHVGLNGGLESLIVARMVLPAVAKVELHGLHCHTENRTILMIEKWLPGHADWRVLYFHAKGCTKPPGDSFTSTWRACMMRHVVTDWRKCVADLDSGYDAVGCHWMSPPATPPGQHIFAGTFFWSKSSFLATLPSIMARDRIKQSGLDSPESRYEAEVWLGNGPRIPKVKDYHGPNWNPSKIATCHELIA